jgi:hypothetical protein
MRGDGGKKTAIPNVIHHRQNILEPQIFKYDATSASRYARYMNGACYISGEQSNTTFLGAFPPL